MIQCRLATPASEPHAPAPGTSSLVWTHHRLIFVFDFDDLERLLWEDRDDMPAVHRRLGDIHWRMRRSGATRRSPWAAGPTVTDVCDQQMLLASAPKKFWPFWKPPVSSW